MVVGTPPGTGPQLVDGTWLTGLAGGTNQTYQAGFTANTAASQANGAHIPSGINILQVDTSVSTGSLILPAAVAGTEVTILNNTANGLDVYANASINALTNALDTINALTNSTAFTGITGNAGATPVIIFYCAKNGLWLTK